MSKNTRVVSSSYIAVVYQLHGGPEINICEFTDVTGNICDNLKACNLLPYKPNTSNVL